MTLLNKLNAFAQDENGAVAADWVLMAAGAIGLAIALTSTLGSISIDHANLMGETFSSRGIVTY